ncbi:kinase [Ornithinibacillus gellani]|uniref:sporulation phosphorelay system protein KapB n=1 Tax=Ornithinibacillus gellani TaxID=2293253 RepID=UPI000F4869BD|nr:sporulation phosphorelay system protein KapB [Ornithinibacillus gellani]TQS75973.1 kinase [Ornithinibacillus gellani]
MKAFNNGDWVRAHYNSGTYIGKVLEDRGDRFLIEVHAVHKHPLQGDLHQLNRVEDVYFHERKALAYLEKMNVKKAAVHPFDGELPAYAASLKAAVDEARKKLEAKESLYNTKALQAINMLEKTYYESIYSE